MTSAQTQSQPTSEPTPALQNNPAPLLFSLKGKHVLVTGASGGIGSACALAAAQAGASCCLVVRPGHLDQTSKGFIDPKLEALLAPATKDASQQHCYLEADLNDMTQVKGIFGKALQCQEMNGRIDVLLNCAGMLRMKLTIDFTEEDWDESMNVNLKAAFLLCQAAGRHMTSNRSGKIINMCSLASLQGAMMMPTYASSKAGLANLTRSLSNEWSKMNVNVNAIVPGPIITAMTEPLRGNPTVESGLIARLPAGRWGTTADLAGPFLFLASDASRFVNGTILTVDGGWMAR